MISGVVLFFSLFNNLAIFIALVTLYGYLIGELEKSLWFRRKSILGLTFGVFAIGCMHAKIPVFEGVIVDQRNAIIALSGAFGGPFSAIISAVIAGIYRLYLGGSGALAGVVGVSLSAIAGIILYKFSECFTSIQKAVNSAIFATIIILPGFLFVKDIQTGWELLKVMLLPYGFAIFCGIFLVGLLLNKEEERYYLELSFRESEKKYRELVEGTEDLITQTDRHGNFTFVNSVAEKMLGVSPKECIGMSVFDFIHPDDLDRTIEWFDGRVSKQHKEMKIENRQVNAKTGESRTVMWSSSLQVDESGSLIGVGGIARDITDQKTAEEALLESEERFRGIVESMADWMWEVDADGRYTNCSQKVEHLLGYSPEEMLGKTPFDFMAPGELKKSARHTKKLLPVKSGLKTWKIGISAKMAVMCVF